MIDRPIRFDQGPPASEAPIAAQYILPLCRTTLVERFLLSVTLIILPLQDHIPAVAGMSVMFLIFATLAAYVIMNRPRILGEMWYQPVFIAAYAFIVVSALLEFSSPLSWYDAISRFGQMIGGAIFLAVLCRDRSALAAGLYGYILAGLWVAVVLCLTSYGVLQGMGDTADFDEASRLRNQAFADKSLQGNINAMAFVSAQGAIVAFALSLSGRLKQHRIPLLGITIFCLVASFLPMSRGTAVASLVSFATILYAHGVRHGKALILASILGLGIYMLVPGGVWSRMVYSTEVKAEGGMEGRAYLYTNALNRLPEYIVSGVGAGNFNYKWGFEKGFTRPQGDHVIGAHNALLQITICWGVLGLSMFVWIIWCVYRVIPLRCGRDELSLALVGVIVSLGIWLLQNHTFYDKSFACGLGMLVGARQWIWPTGMVPAVDLKPMPLARSN